MGPNAKTWFEIRGNVGVVGDNQRTWSFCVLEPSNTSNFVIATKNNREMFQSELLATNKNVCLNGTHNNGIVEGFVDEFTC